MKINILNRIKKGIIDEFSLNKKGNKDDDEHTPKGEIDIIRLWSGRVTQVLKPLVVTGLISAVLGEKLLLIVEPLTKVVEIIYSIVVT